MNGYEVAVKEITPAVRLLIARELKAKYNMREKDIAKRLNIAQAAVSKYLSGKYSKRIGDAAARIDGKYVDTYIEGIMEGRKDYAQICVCTVCKSVNDFGCKFSYARSVK